MKITVLRHGRTKFNAENKYLGSTDQPLSEEGIAAAKRAIPKPEVAEVFVSPMTRARQTAEILFPNAEQIILDGMREMDFGDFEGRTEEEIAASIKGYIPWVPHGPIMDYPNGENMEIFAARTKKALEQVIDAKQNQGHAYVVAHGGTIMALMYQFSNVKVDLYHWHSNNLCGYTVTVGEKGLEGGFAAFEPYITPLRQQ